MKSLLLLPEEPEKGVAMRCQEFDEILIELACDRPLDASVCEHAAVHTAVCESCARRLAAQRELTARVHEFSVGTENLHASPRVKERLRAAVAERSMPLTAFGSPALALPSVMANASARRASWPRWTLAAAAVILVLFMITMVWRRHSTAPIEKELAEGPSAPTQTQSRTAPAFDPAPPETPRDQAVARPLQPSQKDTSRRRATRNNSEIESEVGTGESASEFVPLTPVVDEKAIENGLIVRLEVSRSKLIALGFPLHAEGGQETVNAEVMMGDNGVAYAIRVVR
jgi:hypothetical protein